MAVSVPSLAELGDHHACAVAPTNEGQHELGLVVQLVALGAPRGMEGIRQ